MKKVIEFRIEFLKRSIQMDNSYLQEIKKHI